MRRILPTLILLLLLTACKDSSDYFLEAKPKQSTAPASDAVKLVLPLEVEQEVAENFVRIAYGINQNQKFQSTEFLTPLLRTSQAAPLIKLVKHYNNFDGERVASAIASLKGKTSGIEFGREGSPVIYIQLPYWTHQREEAKPDEKDTRISDEQADILIGEIKKVFVDQLNADQFSVNGRRIRIWWD